MKMSIRVILKCGIDFTIKCEEFTLKQNGLGIPTGYSINGITENKPIYLDFEQVTAVLRVQSDEANE